MGYIIGRNATNGQLSIVNGQSQKSVGNAGSVPATVSRQHLELTQIEGTPYFNLHNLKTTNETFVNGVSVVSKRVSTADIIELGADRYRLDWNFIDIPVIIDISPLKTIWEDYKQKRKELQINREKFGAIKSVAGVFSTLGILATIMVSSNDESGGINIRTVFMIIAVVFILATTAISWRKASSNADEQEKMDQDFRHNYVCPKCHHFMGNQPFDILIQNDRCPYCKVQYKKFL